VMQDTAQITVREAFGQYKLFFSQEDLAGLDAYMATLPEEIRTAVERTARSYRWLREHLVARLARNAA